MLSFVLILEMFSRSGFYQRAYSCLLEAGNVNTADCFMEKTKWHWNKVSCKRFFIDNTIFFMITKQLEFKKRKKKFLLT